MPAPAETVAHPPARTDRPAAATDVDRRPERTRRKRTWLIGLGILIAAGIFVGWMLWPTGTVTTDDAFIDGTIVRLSPQVAGRVREVLVADNERVEAGDPIVRIDTRDLQARVDEAQAVLELAQAQHRAAVSQVELTRVQSQSAVEEAQAALEAAQARAAQANAEVATAEAEQEQAESDLARYEKLDERAVSAERRQQARTDARLARARLDAAQKRSSAAQADIAAAKSQLAAAQTAPVQIQVQEAQAARYAAEVARAEAQLAAARLQLGYATVTAPTSGRVTRKSVSVGDYVQPGQSLMAVVPLELWVTANFKETDLTHMQPGQPAHIEIDAYPDHDFEGHVDSIQAGSGAAFSLLPPENATGNYVKVVQRVPVKIVFDEQPDPERYHLGPGMSVVPTVDVE